MKRIFNVTMLCLVCIICQSQERKNNPGITFDKVSAEFPHAIGWSYDSSLERWAEEENAIRSEIFAPIEFTSMLCKSFEFQNRRYYALFITNTKNKKIYLFDYKYADIFKVNDEDEHVIKGLFLTMGEGTWYESRKNWTEEDYAFYLAKNWEAWIDNPYSTSEQNEFHYQKIGENMRFQVGKLLRFDWFYFETPIRNFKKLFPKRGIGTSNSEEFLF